MDLISPLKFVMRIAGWPNTTALWISTIKSDQFWLVSIFDSFKKIVFVDNGQ